MTSEGGRLKGEPGHRAALHPSAFIPHPYGSVGVAYDGSDPGWTASSRGRRRRVVRPVTGGLLERPGARRLRPTSPLLITAADAEGSTQKIAAPAPPHRAEGPRSLCILSPSGGNTRVRQAFVRAEIRRIPATSHGGAGRGASSDRPAQPYLVATVKVAGNGRVVGQFETRCPLRGEVFRFVVQAFQPARRRRRLVQAGKPAPQFKLTRYQWAVFLPKPPSNG